MVQAQGEVVEIDDSEFTAQFTDPLDERINIMVIPKKQIDEAILVLGAAVRWTLFETGKFRRDRTSRVRLRHEPGWDPEKLQRDSAAFSFLDEVS